MNLYFTAVGVELVLTYDLARVLSYLCVCWKLPPNENSDENSFTFIFTGQRGKNRDTRGGMAGSGLERRYDLNERSGSVRGWERRPAVLCVDLVYGCGYSRTSH